MTTEFFRIGGEGGQKYENIGALGKSNYYTVNLAKFVGRDDKPLVAIKRLKNDHDPQAVLGFFRELTALYIVNPDGEHKQVMHPLDKGFSPYFIALEYLKSGSLEEAVKSSGGRLDYASAIEIVKGICKGLTAVHDKGVVHRDIKPANILFRESEPVITDFSIAYIHEGFEQERVVVGTPYYLPPENYTHARVVTPSADLYSLGVTLFRITTGAFPFTGTSGQYIIQKHIYLDPPKPTEDIPDFPQPLEDVILRLLQKKPDDRFQSAEETREALEDIEKKL